MSEQFRQMENIEELTDDEIKERMVQVGKTAAKLHYLLTNTDWAINGTKEYTLTGTNIGEGKVENTPLAARQLVFALALSENPVVKKISEQEAETLPLDNLQEVFRLLLENRPLNNLKILDLGCGHLPTFARVCRALGANVYTTDRVGADSFEYLEREKIDPKIIEIERQNHIQIDLESTNSAEVLAERTGGLFHLTTESHLDTDDFYKGEEIGLQLLRRGGVHKNTRDIYSKYKIKF